METMVSHKRLVKNFCELARIKSPSGQEDEITKDVIERLRKLGISQVRNVCDNLVVEVPGFGESLILCAHLDTVAVGSKEKINPIRKNVNGEERIESDGKVILGADNKDYIVAILEMITVIKENNLSHCALEIVFTAGEEEISRGAKDLFKKCSLRGKECLISDSSDPFGTITLSAPYCEKFMVTIEGEKAHSKEPEKGVNAIAVAMEIISSIPLGRISSLVTTNIGFVFGGLKDKMSDIIFDNILAQGSNSIPDIFKFCGEIRGADRDKFEETLNCIQKVLNRPRKAKTEASFKRLADGYVHTKDDLFVTQITDVFKDQKIEPRFISAVGGSDANIFNANGIKTVVISSAHRNNHQSSEYLIIDDLVKLADFLVKFVTKK